MSYLVPDLERALRPSQPLTPELIATTLATYRAVLGSIAEGLDGLADQIDPDGSAIDGLPWTLMGSAHDVRGVAQQLGGAVPSGTQAVVS